MLKTRWTHKQHLDHPPQVADHEPIAYWAQALKAAGARCLMVISGSHSWTLECARSLQHIWSDSLWLTNKAQVAAIPLSQARSYLGAEKELVVYDCWAGFDTNAFGIVSGIVKGGGVLALLTPLHWSHHADLSKQKIATWPFKLEQISNRFLERLQRLVEDNPSVAYLSQHRCFLPRLKHKPWQPTDGLFGCRSEEQSRAVEAILRQPHQPRTTLFIEARRGRGKSSALGIAAGLLVKLGYDKILVTSSHLTEPTTLFHHAQQLLPAARIKKYKLEWQGLCIQYVAADKLHQQSLRGDILLIDEASAISLPQLSKIFARAQQQEIPTVLAATQEGYEGTAQGLHFYFLKNIKKLRRICLHTPLRFCSQDPLENLVSKMLLLNCKNALPHSEQPEKDKAQMQYHWLNRDKLVQEEPLLRDIVCLLSQAHYRTTPLDVRRLLDGPGINILRASLNNHTIGFAMIGEEGCIPPPLGKAIWLGRRRVQGHLVPQSLAFHIGALGAVALRGYRVIRIAIHAPWQGIGIGKKLVSIITQRAQRHHMDWVASSFGANQKLLHFWHASELKVVYYGQRLGTSTGLASALVLRGLSEAGRELVRLCEHKMHRAQALATDDMTLETQDWLDLIACGWGRRPVETTQLALSYLSRVQEHTNTALPSLAQKHLHNTAELRASIRKVVVDLCPRHLQNLIEQIEKTL